MRAREKRLSKVVEGIYDAGLGNRDWTSVIGEISALLGRGQACLEYMNYNTLEGRALGVFGYAGDSNELDELYPLLIENDPWAPRIPWNYGNDFALGARILTEQERLATFFVNELCPVIGLETRDILGTFLTRSCGRGGAKASVGALMIYSGENQDPFERADLTFMETLRPHLVKALEIQARLEVADTATAAQQLGLDSLPTAFWMLDRDGRILFANTKALQMQEGAAFRVQDLVLHFADPDVDIDLQRAIAEAGMRNALNPLKDGGAFLTHPPGFANPLSVLVAPASSETTLSLIIDAPSRPSVVVSISDANPILTPKLRIAQRLYNLTDAETSVLTRFAEGGSAQTIADQTGNSVLTIRTQLKSIMEKAGVHSQRELIALVLTGVP